MRGSNIIEDIMLSNLVDDAPLEHKILVSRIVFWDLYYYLTHENDQKTKWYEWVDLILSSDDSNFLKQVCNSCFAANVASNVHNIADWLTLLYKLLVHKNMEVRRHAFSLFDTHFATIWLKDITRSFHGKRG